MTIRAAPTRRPAPNIEIKFMILYEVINFDGAYPNIKVVKNMPTDIAITSDV